MITTNGLNHLALPVRDPERSARFYANLFNMEITSSSPEVAFPKTIGSTDMIALTRSEVEAVSSRESMHLGFMVDPEQFDEALRTIEEQAVKKVSEPSRRSTGRFVFIEDLDGYTVEIFECLSPPYAYNSTRRFPAVLVADLGFRAEVVAELAGDGPHVVTVID